MFNRMYMPHYELSYFRDSESVQSLASHTYSKCQSKTDAIKEHVELNVTTNL